MKKMMTLLFIIFTFILSLAFAEEDGSYDGFFYYDATVKAVAQAALESDGIVDAIYMVEVEFTSGPQKGERVTIEHTILLSDAFPMHLKINDKVIVGVTENSDGVKEHFVNEYKRSTGIYALVLVFIIAILWVGRWQGVKTVMTLVATLGLIAFVHIPLLLKGVSPVTTTIGVAFVATTITIFIITGNSKKSYAAILGTLLGVVLAGVISLIVGKLMHITGLSNEEAVMLQYIPQGDIFKPTELLLSGILLGALGAVMDVAMSIASSIEEINAVSPNLTWRQLYNSGMNIGRDVMGTMTNTLILAYVGSSLPLILLFTAHKMPMIRVMNFDLIATEFARALAGSIGIVLCIPITAAIATALIKRKKV